MVSTANQTAQTSVQLEDCPEHESKTPTYDTTNISTNFQQVSESIEMTETPKSQRAGSHDVDTGPDPSLS